MSPPVGAIPRFCYRNVYGGSVIATRTCRVVTASRGRLPLGVVQSVSVFRGIILWKLSRGSGTSYVRFRDVDRRAEM